MESKDRLRALLPRDCLRAPSNTDPLFLHLVDGGRRYRTPGRRSNPRRSSTPCERANAYATQAAWPDSYNRARWRETVVLSVAAQFRSGDCASGGSRRRSRHDSLALSKIDFSLLRSAHRMEHQASTGGSAIEPPDHGFRSRLQIGGQTFPASRERD